MVSTGLLRERERLRQRTFEGFCMRAFEHRAVPSGGATPRKPSRRLCVLAKLWTTPHLIRIGFVLSATIVGPVAFVSTVDAARVANDEADRARHHHALP
jgi:hypothetical protein